MRLAFRGTGRGPALEERAADSLPKLGERECLTGNWQLGKGGKIESRAGREKHAAWKYQQRID